MEIDVAQIANVIGAATPGEPPRGKATGWSIDSRSLANGDVFFALKGEHVDGHQFVADVLQRGAAAVIVEESVPWSSGVILQVANVEAALKRLAGWARERWGHPIVGVTGSAGKTTTKDAIAALLGIKLKVGRTTGNFNNHLGVPLSILRMPDSAELGVIELGMNHAGEIRDLAAIAKPSIGVITNVGYAHIENFQSIDDIAAAKRELVEALPADGVAVLNADDPRVASFARVHRGKVVTYGLDRAATIRAEQVKFAADGVIFCVDGVRFRSKLLGRHGILNILAALAVAGLYGISLAECVEPVSQLEPGKMRGQRSIWRGVIILDDCYNSNPDAARLMIDVLKDEPADRLIAVLGEMLELGQWSETLHRETGSYAAEAGVHVLVGIRGAAAFMVEAAASRGMNGNAFFFNEPEPAGAFLQKFVRAGDAILFKGSRGTHVERALAVMES
jgi:UDP-N-acetylmuramoyl-tripeptide--D-alanyl-D-alanine ligase